MLYSPINYQGNKSRISEEIIKLIPSDVDCIHEVFCGSAIISLASNIKNVCLNDINTYILDLLKYFQKNMPEDIIKIADNIIDKYGLTNTFYEGKEKYPEKQHEGLSKFNKNAFNKLKDDYNKDKDINKLFVLLIYGFNHYLRFNSKDEYNVPVGKTDFVESLRKRTIEYCLAIQSKSLEITNFDFREEKLYKNKGDNDLYYFDPPYLITVAPYNSFWSEKEEKDLLNILDKLHENGQKFMLSNVIESNGKENKILKEWMKKYKVHYIKRQYLNSSYQKKNLSDAIEVVITNYEGELMEEIRPLSGTSGNRQGNKIFSFNTSVRNPKRNDEFLKAFVSFEGKVFDADASHSYLCELVKRGIYQFMIVPDYIKQKWDNDEPLTKKEVEDLIRLNPQATGEHNRVMTSYMRSLKDQGFLIFKQDEESGRHHKIYLTKLGKDLIDPDKDVAITYTKAMLGVHAKNPARTAMDNKSRPFLNALFAINEVNKKWSEMGNDAKGVLKHEFSTFILSMKDCDYKRAAEEIIKYRLKNRYEINMVYINQYLDSQNILPLARSSICNDYPDDVFRKFEMTGLIMSHGKFRYVYYNLSNYNIEKVNAILSEYQNYQFEEFETKEDYYDSLSNIQIPWMDNTELRIKIAKAKSNYLGREFNDSIPLEHEELQLDRAFYTHALSKAIENTDEKLIYKELLILSGIIKEKSKYSEISESLRLEYLLAMCLGKKYGTDGLVSNIIYNEEGLPLHCAVGNKCDIILFRKEGSFILEPTMLCTRDQQTNAETTSIARHAEVERRRSGLEFRVMMVAPRIHVDVADYFCYNAERKEVKMTTLSIAKVVGLFADSPEIENFKTNFDQVFEKMISNVKDLSVFVDYVNMYRPDESIYS